MPKPTDTYVQNRDLTGLLFEANDADRSLRHARMGLQASLDPEQETKRMHEAWQALRELAARAYPRREP